MPRPGKVPSPAFGVGSTEMPVGKRVAAAVARCRHLSLPRPGFRRALRDPAERKSREHGSARGSPGPAPQSVLRPGQRKAPDTLPIRLPAPGAHANRPRACDNRPGRGLDRPAIAGLRPDRDLTEAESKARAQRRQAISFFERWETTKKRRAGGRKSPVENGIRFTPGTSVPRSPFWIVLSSEWITRRSPG